MSTPTYKLNFDFESNEIMYTPSSGGHGKPIKLTYDDINSDPQLINKFSARDAYFIGTVQASNALDKLEILSVQPRYKYFILIAVLFVTTMIISNILSIKLVSLFGHTVTGAMLIYPFTYIFDYIITDVYGYQNARRVILATLVSLVSFDLCILALEVLPPSPFWNLQHQLDMVFGQMLRTFVASTAAFSFSFFISSYILQKTKVQTKGGSLFKRIFRSLLISEISDTGLFCFLAFYGIWPLENMALFILISYFTKVTYELVVYGVITKPLIAYIKKEEKLDIIDTDTDFTPFSWKVSYTDKNNIYLSTTES